MLAMRVLRNTGVKFQKKLKLSAVSHSVLFKSDLKSFQILCCQFSSEKKSSNADDEIGKVGKSGEKLESSGVENVSKTKPETYSEIPSSSAGFNVENDRLSHPSHKPETYLHNASKTVGATLHYADQKLHTAAHFAGQTYEEMEKNLMKTLKATNQREFRIKLVGGFLFVLWILAVFGDRIRKSLTDQTAGLAKETLENESLKVQTQELAMAVVQTILNDKEITAHAAAFLKEASIAPETQQALLELTIHILQHDDSLAQLTSLTKKLIDNLSSDQETVAKCASLLTSVLEDAKLKAALVGLLTDLCKEPVVVQTVTELALKVIARNDIYNATTDLLTKSSTELLADEQVQDQSRLFVAQVMGDDALQREGGDALWNSITHALKPGFIRVTGAALVGVSFALLRVMFSPY